MKKIIIFTLILIVLLSVSVESKFSFKKAGKSIVNKMENFSKSVGQEMKKDVKKVGNAGNKMKTEIFSSKHHKKHIGNFKQILENIYQYIFVKPFHKPRVEQTKSVKKEKLNQNIGQSKKISNMKKNSCYFEIDQNLEKKCEESYVFVLTEEQKQHRQLYQQVQELYDNYEEEEDVEINQNQKNKKISENPQFVENQNNKGQQSSELDFEQIQDFVENYEESEISDEQLDVIYEQLVEYIEKMDKNLNNKKKFITASKEQIFKFFDKFQFGKGKSLSPVQLTQIRDKIYSLIDENGKEEFQDYWQCFFENLYIKC